MPCLVFIHNHYDGWPHYEPSFTIQFCCLLKLQKSFGSHFCNVLQVRYFWFFLFSRFPTQSIELYLFQAVVTHDMTEVSYSFLAFWYSDTAALWLLSMIPTSWFISYDSYHSAFILNTSTTDYTVYTMTVHTTRQYAKWKRQADTETSFNVKHWTKANVPTMPPMSKIVERSAETPGLKWAEHSPQT